MERDMYVFLIHKYICYYVNTHVYMSIQIYTHIPFPIFFTNLKNIHTYIIINTDMNKNK
jgi:hypothetical protein